MASKQRFKARIGFPRERLEWRGHRVRRRDLPQLALWRARRWPLLRQRPCLCGAAYGLLLYGVMNYVVVPLSKARPAAKDPLWIGLSIAVHVALIGIPCAVFAARAARVQ